jgi:acyl-CoA synthetase (AMP-forming)/AMP-acid ligase II
MTTWNELACERWLGSDRIAVLTTDVEWTGDELLRRAGGAAEWLESCGFRSGAGVPALLDETPTAVAVAVGAALSGRALAPLGTRLPPTDLAAAVKAYAGPGLVTTPEHAELATDVARLVGTQMHVLDGPPPPRRVPETSCGADDVAVIVHTSGTTGAPKPILMRQGQLAARVAIYGSVMGFGPGDRYCSASPLHHTAGITMTFTALGQGVTVIPQAWFSVEGWREAGRLGVTHILLVPTMIDLLLTQGALADAKPKVLQYGAAPIDPAMLREALAALPDVEFLQIFGQTEVSPVTALTHSDHLRGLADRPDLLATVGRAVAGVELRIENPDDDGIGEVTVRAPHTFVTDVDGWRRMGDLGRIDDEGYLSLQGRVHDRIVRGGENIYPVEVEQALLSHPGVQEVAVVGVPDRRYGETVKAVIVAKDPTAPPSTDELRAHARARLAPFKVPDVIELITALPRNAGGKVLRRQLV